MNDTTAKQRESSQQSIENMADNCLVWLPKVCHILVDQWQISQERSANMLSIHPNVLNQALVGDCPEFISTESAIRGSIILALADKLEAKLGNVRSVALWMSEERTIPQFKSKSARSLLESEGYSTLLLLDSILDDWV